MPRIVSEEERQLTKQALHQACIALIKSKGLWNVTVADITKAAGMAKGSFYFYYQTKEELLYEVIKISSHKMLDRMMSLRFDAENFKEDVESILFDIYLAPDSLVLYIKPMDMEYLLRKSPAEIREQESERSQNSLAQVGEFFGLQVEDRGTVDYLMDALWMVASHEEDYGKNSRQQSLEILVYAIADFINEKSTKKKI